MRVDFVLQLLFLLFDLLDHVAVVEDLVWLVQVHSKISVFIVLYTYILVLNNLLLNLIQAMSSHAHLSVDLPLFFPGNPKFFPGLPQALD